MKNPQEFNAYTQQKNSLMKLKFINQIIYPSLLPPIEFIVMTLWNFNLVELFHSGSLYMNTPICDFKYQAIGLTVLMVVACLCCLLLQHPNDHQFSDLQFSWWQWDLLGTNPRCAWNAAISLLSDRQALIWNQKLIYSCTGILLSSHWKFSSQKPNNIKKRKRTGRKLVSNL